MRRGCHGCHLIEPEEGTWVNGFCPRCRPAKKRFGSPLGTKRGPGISGQQPTRRKDLTGQVFGWLTVESYAYTKNGYAHWNCRCKCGAEKPGVERGHLTNGKSFKSCGCYGKQPTVIAERIAKMQAVRRRNRLSPRAAAPKKLRPFHGEHHNKAKLSEAQVIAIRDAYAGGDVTTRQLAARYSIRQGTVSQILNYRTWKHLKPSPLASNAHRVDDLAKRQTSSPV